MSANAPDPWGALSRLLVACVLERPERLERMALADLAGGPMRDLAALMRKRSEAGLAIDLGAMLGVAGDELRAVLFGLAEEPIHQDYFDRYLVEARLHAGQAQARRVLEAGPVDADTLREAVQLLEQVAHGQRGGLGLVPLFGVSELAVEWAWRGRLPVGAATVMAGDGGVGKSTLAQEIAARITRGQSLPGGLERDPRPVIVLSGEEDTRAVIRARMRLMGADLARVFVIDPAIHKRGLRLPSHAGHLEADVERLGAGLVVIDTGPAFLDRGLRSNAEEDVRAFLDPLADMAQRHDAASLVLAHLNKGEGRSARHRVMGGAAWVNAPRSVLMVGPPPGEDARQTPERYVVLDKSNLSPHPWPDAVSFRLRPDQDDGTRAVISWGREVPGITSDGMFNPPAEEERTKLDDAVERLGALLGDGPRPAEDCDAALRKVGHSVATIRRARLEFGITREAGTVYQDGFRGPYMWRLPVGAEEASSTGAHPPVSTRAGERPWSGAESQHDKRDHGVPTGPSDSTGAHPRDMSTRGDDGPSERRTCTRCGEPWAGLGTVCEACLGGEP
jgi:hypothetical protein